jgi:hypothetical protein
MSQLGLDGTETMLPLRLGRPLTERQRELVAYMRAHGVVSPTELGVLMHQGRETPCVVLLDFRRMPVGCCEHASSDGGDALRRLARRGLVERIARGRWQLIPHDETWTS